MFRRSRAAVVAIAAALICTALGATARAETPSIVMQAAQLAFYTRNAEELRRLAATTSAWAGSADSLELYAHAYVQFRALQLAIGAKRKAEAEKSGAACVGALDGAVKKNAKFAEAFALQSACYGYLANLGGFGAIRNGSRSGKSIAPALALEPKNPRVVLVDGFGVYFRPAFVGGDKAKGCARFREAAALFDVPGPRTALDGIDWGAAEARYWAGRCAADAGDAAGARRYYEAALALAPQFAAARTALK